MKLVVFGNFCVQVPILSDQSNETPLAKSSAKYIGMKHSLTPTEYNVTHVEGQQLVGTMIPQKRVVRDLIEKLKNLKDQHKRSAASAFLAKQKKEENKDACDNDKK